MDKFGLQTIITYGIAEHLPLADATVEVEGSPSAAKAAFIHDAISGTVETVPLRKQGFRGILLE